MGLAEKSSMFSGMCFDKKRSAKFALLLSLFLFVVTGFSYLQHLDGIPVLHGTASAFSGEKVDSADKKIITEIVEHHSYPIMYSERDSGEQQDDYFHLNLSSMRQYFYIFRAPSLSTLTDPVQEVKAHKSAGFHANSLPTFSYEFSNNLSAPNFIRDKIVYFRC